MRGTVTSYRINVNFLKQDKKISGYEWNEIVGHLERVETDAGFVMQTKHEDSEVIIDFMRIRNIDPSVVKESPSPEMMRVLLGYIQSKGIRTVRFAYILKRGAEFFERELSKYTKDKSEVKIDFDQLPEDPATHASYYEIDLSDFDFSYSGVLAGKVQRAELRQSEEARNLSDRINGIVNEVVRKSYASDTLQVIDTGDYRRGTNVTDVINLRPTLTGVQGLDRVWTDGSVKDLTPLSAELKNIENVAKHDLQLAELIRELEKRFKDEEASIHFESLKSGPDFRGVVLHFSGVTKDKKNLIIQVTLDESAESFLVEHTAHFLSLMQTLEEKIVYPAVIKLKACGRILQSSKDCFRKKPKTRTGKFQIY
jgi:hypothetical protein